MTPEMFEAMYRHAVRKAHGFIPPQEVEDAAQTAMLAVVRASRRLQPGRDPWPLLTMVVRQELGMYARGLYNSPETAVGDNLTAFERPGVPAHPDGFSGPVRAALETLTPRQREAVVECVAEGRPKTVAGQLMGVSDSRVGHLVRSAIPALRAALEAA